MKFDDSASSFYAFKVMALVILFQEVGCVQLIFWFPCVICFWIPFPFEEILESFVLPKVAVTSDGFHFVSHFSIDQVRRRPHEVGAVGRYLDEWG
jgi:hypothetical protein